MSIAAFRAILLKHNKNKQDYLVDGYVMYPNNNNFEDFFGYVGQKTGSVKNLPEKARKGTLRIERW